MPGSSSTWRTIARLPNNWQPPPPRPSGPCPVAGDIVTRRGTFQGKTEEVVGKITDVYARKGSGRSVFRWLAKVTWVDGEKAQIRVELLKPDFGDGWIIVVEGRTVWR